MFNSQNIIAAYTEWFQFQMYICINFYRFFDGLHLFQHLFAAFGTFDGFFAVERTKLLLEFRDDSFLMLDFLLLVKIFLQAYVAKLLLLCCIVAVVSHISTKFSKLDFKNFSDNFVQKITVVRHDQHSSLIV